MEDVDSDLEDGDEHITVHAKKRSYQEMTKESTSSLKKTESATDPAMERTDHYDTNHSRSKIQKLEAELMEMANLDSFLNHVESEHDEDEDSDLEKLLNEEEEEEEEVDNTDLVIDGDFAIQQSVDFELMDIHQGYYHQIRDMLGATDWDQRKLRVVELSDAIVSQEEIGCVIVSGDSVLGFMTVLSFKKYQYVLPHPQITNIIPLIECIESIECIH